METKGDLVIVLPEEKIVSKIYILRGKKIILDKDLAGLYEVPTKVLNQSVSRNIERFPSDFMFQLSRSEFSGLMSQFVTSNTPGRGGVRKIPYAFTEQGVAIKIKLTLWKRNTIKILRLFSIQLEE